MDLWTQNGAESEEPFGFTTSLAKIVPSNLHKLLAYCTFGILATCYSDE